MSPNPSHRPITLSELHMTRDRLPWPYKFFTVLSTWFIAGAFILAPVFFYSEQSNLKPTRDTLIILAVAMLASGYILLLTLAYASHSLLFRFEAVAIPLLTASLLGEWAIVLNHALHKSFPVGDIYIQIPLALCSTSLGCSIIYAGWLWHRIRMIRRNDSTSGQYAPLPLRNESPYPSPALLGGSWQQSQNPQYAKHVRGGSTGGSMGEAELAPYNANAQQYGQQYGGA